MVAHKLKYYNNLEWTEVDEERHTWHVLVVTTSQMIVERVYITWSSRNKLLKEKVVITSQMIVKQVQLHVYYSPYEKFPEFERTIAQCLSSGQWCHLLNLDIYV